MFSDLSYDTPVCDIPPPFTQTDEDPFALLDFDNLLDIAREFEFTRTITHIWPYEEPNTCETGLDDILAAILPTPHADEYPPLPRSVSPILLEPIHLEEVDTQRPVSMWPAPDENASASRDSVPALKDVQCEAEYPITAVLRGWSPPNGSQFLDLDDSLAHPRSAEDLWISPWLTSFLAPPTVQPAGSINPSSVTAQVTYDMPQATEPEGSCIAIDKALDDPTQKVIPFRSIAETRTHLKPDLAGSTLPFGSHTQSQTPHHNVTKHRVLLSIAPAARGLSNVKHAKSPRGGIPPHIARTITKANSLRIEKERKVMQHSFSSTNTEEGKKPSVLQRAIRAEKVGSGGSGKKHFDLHGDRKKGRGVKKVKV